MQKALFKESVCTFAAAVIFLTTVPALAADLTASAAFDIESAQSVSVNRLKQDVTQSWHGALGATHAGDITFGDETFALQNGAANNLNSGVNAAQQSAVALAIDTESGEIAAAGLDSAGPSVVGAVAINRLQQVAAQSYTLSPGTPAAPAVTSGAITFGSDTFRDQRFSVNNVNSGINATQ